jgi:hypothetical protein
MELVAVSAEIAFCGGSVLLALLAKSIERLIIDNIQRFEDFSWIQKVDLGLEKENLEFLI